MRKNIFFLLALLLFSGCETDGLEESTAYSPVLLTRENLEKSVKWDEPQKLDRPGKIYLKDNYLFINEKCKGVHVYDNSTPSNPINEGFIRIPGNIDIAMRGNIIYADNAIDLVAIEFTAPGNITELNRQEDVFSELLPPGYSYVPYEFTKDQRPSNTIIIDWIKTKNIQ